MSVYAGRSTKLDVRTICIEPRRVHPSLLKLPRRPSDEVVRDLDGLTDLREARKSAALVPPREFEDAGLQHLRAEGRVLVDPVRIRAISAVLRAEPRAVGWDVVGAEERAVANVFSRDCVAVLGCNLDGLRLGGYYGGMSVRAMTARHGYDARDDVRYGPELSLSLVDETSIEPRNATHDKTATPDSGGPGQE